MPDPFAILTKNAYSYEELRRRILTSAIQQASVLSQSRLAQEIGVSTTPCAKPLRHLAAAGMVELKSHSDARMASLTADEAQNLYVIRDNPDPLAAGLAAKGRTPSDIENIHAALKRLTPLHDAADLDAMTAHREFHRAIYSASHNSLRTGILEGLWDKTDHYRQTGLQGQEDSQKDRIRVQAEHRQIADAVVAGDAVRAREIKHRHVLGSLGRKAIPVLGTD